MTSILTSRLCFMLCTPSPIMARLWPPSLLVQLVAWQAVGSVTPGGYQPRVRYIQDTTHHANTWDPSCHILSCLTVSQGEIVFFQDTNTGIFLQVGPNHDISIIFLSSLPVWIRSHNFWRKFNFLPCLVLENQFNYFLMKSFVKNKSWLPVVTAYLTGDSKLLRKIKILH